MYIQTLCTRFNLPQHWTLCPSNTFHLFNVCPPQRLFGMKFCQIFLIKREYSVAIFLHNGENKTFKKNKFGSLLDCDFSLVAYLRVTLDKGPKSGVQWNRTFLLVKSFKLASRLVDKGLGQRWIKLWFSLHGIVLEGKLIGTDPKKRISRRAQGLENQSVS
jgi:hypothetical protein